MNSLFTTTRPRRTGLFVLLAILLIGVERIVVQTPSFVQRSGLLSWAVTADLVLGLPLLYYFIVSQPLKLSRWSLTAIAGGSLFVAWWVLPDGARQPVICLREGVMLAELGVGIYFVSQTRRLIRQYRQMALHRPDFVLNLHESVRLSIGQGRAVQVLTSELITWRYGLLGWIGSVEAKASQRVFTTHRTSGQIALLVMVTVVALLETGVFHLLLSRWSVPGAWLLTAASLYGILFLIAETVATARRPHLLDADGLHLRFGIRWYGTLLRSQIERIEPISEKPAKSDDQLTGTLLTTPNVVITLRDPVRLNGLYGLTKSVRQVALFVDERANLLNEFGANGAS